MKKRKGFTLIELLAVIVILAIIALIAVPIVLNMVNNAKKSAAKAAALGYIETVEYNMGLDEIYGNQVSYNEKMDGMVLTIQHKKFDNQLTQGIHLSDGINKITDINATGIKIKGKKPTSGYLYIYNRKVSAAVMCVGSYVVDYNSTSNKEARVNNKCTTDEKEGTMDQQKLEDAMDGNVPAVPTPSEPEPSGDSDPSPIDPSASSY